MSDDPMSALRAAEAAVRRRGEEDYSDPTARVTKTTARAVTTSEARRAGQFDRKTIYISPDMIDWVSETSVAEGVGVLAFYRFLLAAGRQAYESGQARPEAAVPLVHRLKTDE